MKQFTVKEIGTIRVDGEAMRIALDPRYAPALRELDGFSHIQVLWWFSGCDNEKDRASLEERSPYKGSPDLLGAFATRSPMRPNPLALTCAQVLYIDREKAEIEVAYLDANDGSPVLDIKPYTPSLDRVQAPATPDWCQGWPDSLEASGDFDWSGVFNF